MSKVQVHVDGVLAMGRRFVGCMAPGRKRRGHVRDACDLPRPGVDAGGTSPRRLELLRHVRQHGAASVRGLAAALGRDYKNVHQDVAALELAGLLVRDGRKLTAPWDELQASVALA